MLDEKNIKGIKHYLIRWKGYEEESDTWEPEDTLDCKELIEEFKKKKKDDKGPKKHKKKQHKEMKEPDWDENEDFEVKHVFVTKRYNIQINDRLTVSWKFISRKMANVNFWCLGKVIPHPTTVGNRKRIWTAKI